MRVLHLPVGRQMIEMCAALRRIGVDAAACHFRDRNQNFDLCLHLEKQSGSNRMKLRERFLKEAVEQYDVFHFHFGETFYKDRSDLEYLKKHGKKLIVQHRGSDVRMLSVANAEGSADVRVKGGRRREEREIVRKLKELSQYIDHAIVADHELLAYIKGRYKHIHLLRQFITLDKFPFSPPSATNRKPLIVHAPTNDYLKGTEYVLQGIDRLRRKGLDFDFKIINDVSHKEAIKEYRKADIIIDQLLQGSFGVLSLEGMALGKPVICYVRDGMIRHYPPGIAIVNANKDTFYDVLKKLVKDPESRREIGIAGRTYIEKHYDSRQLALKLASIYKEL
ncbi:glycosyltransferase family 4 protein [Paenibacillus mendelii]|uniref:Glycosyltransferase family 4 protein n=1 Tax=Paenibacillus mendelii TaxID=206163 RepID=A0ABV6J907_9BACL|nr:glycosyltransferase family 4 protein [Paenibacillus mendelii]MCQ6559717.1 glycosyltransferase family 4 protein [Paenibacillus mendelii]